MIFKKSFLENVFILLSFHCTVSLVQGQLSPNELQLLNEVKLEEDLFGGSPAEMKSNLELLYNARLIAENMLKQDPVAALAEELSENSRDTSCLLSDRVGTDIIYENRTDFARVLNFTPNNYNCGPQFDVGKLMRLVKDYSKLLFKINSDDPDFRLDKLSSCNVGKPAGAVTDGAMKSTALGNKSNFSSTTSLYKGNWWKSYHDSRQNQEIRGKGGGTSTNPPGRNNTGHPPPHNFETPLKIHKDLPPVKEPNLQLNNKKNIHMQSPHQKQSLKTQKSIKHRGDSIAQPVLNKNQLILSKPVHMVLPPMGKMGPMRDDSKNQGSRPPLAKLDKAPQPSKKVFLAEAPHESSGHHEFMIRTKYGQDNQNKTM